VFTYFVVFIVVLLAGCASTGDVTTTPTPPAITNTPTEIVSTIKPLSTVPSSPDAPVTKSTEMTSRGITPSVDYTTLPDKVVITLRQEGGFAGLDQVWILYQDGRILMNGELSGQISAQELSLLQNSIDQSGFFEFDHPEAGNFCCDFFTFTITATMGDRSHSISISDGDPDLPGNINEIISVLLQSLSS
jgi:hypothetical protein